MIRIKYDLKTGLAMLAGVAALSASAIFVRLASAPSSAIALYRLLFTALVLLPFLVFSRKNRAELRALRRRQVAAIIVSGLLLAIHYVLWFESLRFTSVSSSTVLVSLQPLFSLLYGIVFLKERLRKSDAVGCVIAIAGSAIIGWGDFQIGESNLLGDFLALAAAGVISLYFLIGQVARRDVGAVTYSTLGYFSSTVFLLLYALVRHDSLSGFTPMTWAAFLGLALISTIGGQFVFNLLLKKVSASAVTMSILGEPVGTCILARLLLHETIEARQLIGILIILLGLSVFFFYPMLRGKERQKKT